jgi:hypothetical protein
LQDHSTGQAPYAVVAIDDHKGPVEWLHFIYPPRQLGQRDQWAVTDPTERVLVRIPYVEQVHSIAGVELRPNLGWMDLMNHFASIR